MPPPSPAPDRPPADLDALAASLADRVAQLVDAARTPPPLLDLAGAAARLNVSTRTVEALVASGDIPVTRIGAGRGVRRFDPAAVEAFIRRNTRAL
ncbi:helix-turn-helix domain-containing protein [Rubrivirga sp. IMCC45206]|uniref:helix-turn-helix domain-containing protein n=1 Tax=Rubrivirga sp. IMCC45206 TaxID=3391614 RepID=UPI00399011A5